MPSRSAPLFILPIMAFAANTANAADLVETLPPEFTPITYISIEGGPIWTDHGIRDTADDKFGNIEDGKGFYAAATLRRIFAPDWDWQITAIGTWLDETSAGDADSLDGRVRTDLDFQTVDLDFGYHLDQNPLTRLLFGARILHSTNSLGFRNDWVAETFNAEGWAVGPRVGFQSETMLGGSQFGFVAEASGSVLFGNFNVDIDSEWRGSGSFRDTRTLYNLEGLAGLSWHVTDSLTLTGGYRAQQWWGLRKGTSVGLVNDRLSVNENVLVHGPFARLGLTF